MTAASAVGKPPPNLITSALPSFNNEDDEGPFSPTLCDSPFACILRNSRGTQNHVGTHVTKSPPHRSAAANHHDPRRSAPLPTTSPHTTNTNNTCVYDNYDHSAYNKNKKHTDYARHATSAAHPTPLVHTANSRATNRNSHTPPHPVPSPDPRIDSLLALQRQILQDLTILRPAADSNANTNPSSTPPTTTTPPPTTTTLSSTTRMPSTANPPPPTPCGHPNPVPITATTPTTTTDPPDGAIAALQALQHQILCDMQGLDRTTPSHSMQAITPLTTPAQPPQPQPYHHSPLIQPVITKQFPPEPGHTTILPQPNLTATARMISNNTRAESTIWTPHALMRCILPLTPTTCQLPQYPNPATGPLTLHAVHVHRPVNNHPHSNHTTPFATHVPWQTTCLHHHQHPPYIPLVTNIKALAQNMRPP